jgi:hypothetical protein
MGGRIRFASRGKVVVDGLQRIKNGMTVAPTPFKDTQAAATLVKCSDVEFFITAIVAMVIAILTVVVGLVSMAKLLIAQLPDIDTSANKHNRHYTGADALTIEQSVATPLEQQMNGVDNMLYMISTNAMTER